jgi:DNA-binding transcriptional ArsR family regulator
MIYDNILEALGDSTRRRILARLRTGPQPVTVLAEGLPVSRPAVSQHLKILKEAGLVADESRGTRRIYRINRDGLALLRTWLDGFWAETLDAHQAEIQRQIDERKNT